MKHSLIQAIGFRKSICALTLIFSISLFLPSCKKEDTQMQTPDESSFSSLSTQRNTPRKNPFQIATPAFENNQVKMWEFEKNFAFWDADHQAEAFRYLGVSSGFLSNEDILKSSFNPDGVTDVSELDFDLWYAFANSRVENGVTLYQYYNRPRNIKKALDNDYLKVSKPTLSRTKFKVGGEINEATLKAIKANAAWLAFGFNYASGCPQPKEGSDVAPQALKLNTAMFFKTDKGEKSKYGMIVMTQAHNQVLKGRMVEIIPMKIQVWVQK